MDQAHLAAIVVDYVQRFVNQFNATDLVWVRSMKASKVGVLNCQCRTVQIASTVRSTFASLIKSATPPTYLGKISISFAHEVGTRVRLSILRSISRRQKERDPEAICSISAFSARPLLRVGAKDSGTRFLSYVDAVNGFRHLLKQEDLDKALSLCTGLRGHLKSRFIVLSDDRVLPPAPQGQGRGKRPHPGDRNERVNQKRPHTSTSTSTSSSSSALPPSTSWAHQAPPISGSGSAPANVGHQVHAAPVHAGIQAPVNMLPSAVSWANQVVSSGTVLQNPPSNWVNPPVSAAAPIISHNLPNLSGLVQISTSSLQQVPPVASPGVGFPPLSNAKVNSLDDFAPAKSRGRKKKTTVEKNTTPTREVLSRSVKGPKVSNLVSQDQEDQEMSDEGSEDSGAEYVDAPNEGV